MGHGVPCTAPMAVHRTMDRQGLSGSLPQGNPSDFRALRPRPLFDEGADYTDLPRDLKGHGCAGIGGILRQSHTGDAFRGLTLARWTNMKEREVMTRLRSIGVLLSTALVLAACDQGAKAPETPAQPEAQKAVEPTPVAAPAPAAPMACATVIERMIAFTSAQAKDKLIIEALGPDCANPAMFARIFDANGRLVFADMTSGKWLMNVELFPQGLGTPQGVAENLYGIGEPNSMNLPAWKAGAKAPAKGSYGAYEALVPQPAYERLRALNATTLIKRGGGESGTIYIYDPESGEAVAVAIYAV